MPRTLVDRLGAVVWEARPGARAGEAHFTFVSERAESLLGYATDDWLSDSGLWLRIVHPDDRDRVDREITEAVRAGRDADLEFRCHTADGRELQVRNIVKFERDGGAPSLTGVLVDVTERHAELLRLERVQALADALSGLLGARDVADAVAEHVRAAVGADAAAVLLGEGDAPAVRSLPGDGELVSVPLTGDDRELGSLVARMPPGRPLAPADRIVLEVLGRTCAQALQRAEHVAAERAASAMLDAVISTAPEGFALLDTDLRYVRVNDAMARINGVPVAEHLGRTVAEVLPDLPGAEAALRRVLEGGGPLVDIELTGYSPADADRPHTWLASYYPVPGPDGEVAWLGVLVSDITARKRAERRAEVLADLGRSLDEVVNVDERLARLADLLVPSVFEGCAVRLVSGEGDELGAERGELAATPVTIPLVVRGRRLGELSLSPVVAGEDARFAEEVAQRAALAFDNALLFESERLARDRTERQYALAAALAEALTPADVAGAILDQILPAIGAEQATVWQVSEDRLWAEMIGSRGFREADLTGHRRIALRDARPVADAIRGRELLWWRSAAALDAAYPMFGGAFAERGMASCAVFPLLSAGRAVGALFVSASRPLAFAADDRALGMALAAQAAQALERARLFEAERRIAVTLQRSLLPARLPDVDGVEVAVRYLPAAGLEAGGDFYEALPLPDGGIGVAVGDVVGRGASAAAAMGQLRSALRAFALVGEPPAAVLGRLSAFAETVGGAMAATAIVAHLRPETGRLRYACAGHPWPLLVHADGEAAYLKDGRGVPLGCVRGPVFEEAVAALRPGSTLLLYTDGLTERRGEDQQGVHEAVRAAAAAAARAPLAEQLDAAVAAAGATAQADDVALVAVRLTAAAGSVEVLRFRAERAEVPVARAALRQWLAAAGVPVPARDDVLLAAGEAFANAVEHSGSAGVRMELSRPEPGVVAVTVADGGRWRTTGADPARGRGLGLMRALVDEAEVEQGEAGTTVRLRHRFGP